MGHIIQAESGVTVGFRERPLFRVTGPCGSACAPNDGEEVYQKEAHNATVRMCQQSIERVFRKTLTRADKWGRR
jgi:hypothetical protein